MKLSIIKKVEAKGGMVLKAQEAADVLGVSRQIIYTRVTKGEIRKLDLGDSRRVLIPINTFLDYCETQV
jgi:excisionase family DNA binding protein